jgi:hypothetical protein
MKISALGFAIVITSFLIAESAFSRTIWWKSEITYGFKNNSEPDGFRNIRWNAKYDLLSDIREIDRIDAIMVPAYMNVKSPPKARIFQRDNEDLLIGGIRFSRIYYYFLDRNKGLYCVYAYKERTNLEEWEVLKSSFIDTYGETPKIDSGWDHLYIWEGEITNMKIQYNKHNNVIAIEMVSKKH